MVLRRFFSHRLLKKNAFWVFWWQQTSGVIEALPFHTAEWMRSVFRVRIDPRREKKSFSACKRVLMASTRRAGSVKIDGGRGGEAAGRRAGGPQSVAFSHKR